MLRRYGASAHTQRTWCTETWLPRTGEIEKREKNEPMCMPTGDEETGRSIGEYHTLEKHINEERRSRGKMVSRVSTTRVSRSVTHLPRNAATCVGAQVAAELNARDAC